ncbi:hypothetical protein QAD02_007199 [Eretmocerus hayati]|uniref:Uncharacterized protein n=1 Tax=Eretmocerus hayati TaxID=131215 RepID=A0ACC2N316_9HYME|nr:hypothetical protein QAD02_007199 [Eretmocerus hayati]
MLIRDLLSLEREGLTINVNNRVEHLYFCACLEIGDNKSLYQDQGYVTTYNSGRCCRICRADVSQMKKMIVEDVSLLRNEENYIADLKLRCPRETGLIGRCVFDELHSFSAPRNAILDLTHDEFGGSTSYLMTNVCHSLIYEQARMKLEELNKRIDTSNKSCLYISNRIPQIKKNHLSAHSHLRMSFAGMINFVRYFGILVGDIIDRDEQDETWECYLTYRRIVDYLLSPRIVEGHLQQLECIIPEFLLMYISLYNELLYQFHSLVHVVRIVRKLGPMVNYWAMRLESRQREFKATVTGSCNSQNILRTISLRSQLQLAYFKATGTMHIPDIEINHSNKIDIVTREFYFADVSQDSCILCTKNIVFKGIDFEVGMMCVIDMGDNSPAFGLINEIFIFEENATILFQPHTTIHFDRHVTLIEFVLDKLMFSEISQICPLLTHVRS